MAQLLGAHYELLADGREPRHYIDAHKVGAAFFDATREDMPQVVRRDAYRSEHGAAPEVQREVIAQTKRDASTGALVHVLRGVPVEFRAGYDEAAQRNPQRCVALQEQVLAVPPPPPVEMQLGEHLELQATGHVPLTFNNARQAGAAFHAARIEDAPKLVHHEPGQEPRVAAYTSPVVGLLTEHGPAEFPNKVLANDLPIDAEVRAGYYGAVEQSVIAGLAVTDWEQATGREPWSVPRLEQRLYGDLQTLAMSHRELAVQAWLDHAPQWAQKPTFVDLATGQVATLDKVADLGVAKKVQHCVYAGMRSLTDQSQPTQAIPAKGPTVSEQQNRAPSRDDVYALIFEREKDSPLYCVRAEALNGDVLMTRNGLGPTDVAQVYKDFIAPDPNRAPVNLRLYQDWPRISKVSDPDNRLPRAEDVYRLQLSRFTKDGPDGTRAYGVRTYGQHGGEMVGHSQVLDVDVEGFFQRYVMSAQQPVQQQVQASQPEADGLTNTIERAAPSVRLSVGGSEVDKLQFTKFDDHQGRRIDIEARGDDGQLIASRSNLSPQQLEQLVGKDVARTVMTSRLDDGLLLREQLLVQPGRQQAQVPDQPPAQRSLGENDHVGRLTLNNRAVEKLSFSKTRRPEGTFTDVRAFDGEGKVITVAKALTLEALTQMVGQEIAEAIRGAKGRGGTLTGAQLPAQAVRQQPPVQAQAPTQEAAQTQAAAEPVQPTTQSPQTQTSTPAPAIDPAREAADKRTQELKRTLSDRFTIKGEKYLFKADPRRVAFIDTGLKLAAESDTGFVVRGMVDLAEAKGWQALNVKGTEDFRRQAWLEGSVRGLEVRGYSPTPEDRQRLAERQQQLRNGIEPAQWQPPHGGQQPQPPAQAAQRQARDGAPSATRQQHLDVMREILNAQNVPPVKAEVILRKMGEKMDAMQAQGQPLPPIKVFDPQAAPRMAPGVVQPVPHHAPTRGVAR